MKTRTILVSVFLIVLSALLACSATADSATTLFRVTYIQSAANTYNFTLWNDDTTGIVPTGLWLEWTGGTPGTYTSANIDAPSGWSHDTFYDVFYPAWGWDYEPGTEVNGPTGSLSGFVVRAASAPTMFTVSIQDADGNVCEDQLGIAQMVPEPSAAAPILAALGSLGAIAVRRRRERGSR